MNNKKNIYLIAFIILFIIECLIAMFLKQGFIRENVGDILVVPCIYTILRIIFTNKIKYLSLYVLIFAVIVEFMQLLNITTFISNDNKILSIALGGTFDIKDILCYMVGYVLLIVIEIYYSKRGQ
jgi:hypothetical protein